MTAINSIHKSETKGRVGHGFVAVIGYCWWGLWRAVGRLLMTVGDSISDSVGGLSVTVGDCR